MSRVTDVGGPAMICVSIGQNRQKMALAEMTAAGEKADLVEIRLDHFARGADIKELVAAKPCPIVATCRRTQDGGRFEGGEDQRLAILRQAIIDGVDYVDIEVDVAGKVPRYGQTKRIISYHNFEETPNDLEEVHREASSKDPDIVKIVTRARTPSDNLYVMNLIKRTSTPTVAFCMGDMGTASRVLGRKFGAPLAYASLRRGTETAPGQLCVDELLDVYNYKGIDSETELYGLIGNPVAHSLSPAVYNAAFAELGMNCLYLPFRVEDLKEFFKAFQPLGVKGYSVTIPHKQAILGCLAQAENVVRKLKAANTVVWRDGKATGYNTDWRAAVTVLEDAMGGLKPDGGSPLKHRQVLVVGAGGVARAVAYGVVSRGGLLTIVNRTEQKARLLAQELDCRYAPIERINQTVPDVVINCTSVGMYPEVDKCPVHPSFLRENLYVFDTVYNPIETMLVREGRRRGSRVITGMDMFLRQAALQFQLFMGKEPPLDVMRAAAERHLEILTPPAGSADEDEASEDVPNAGGAQGI